jgi:transposase InsO family protein
MDSRLLLVHRVLIEGSSVALAARLAGVSRETAYRWIRRAKEVGLDELCEHSRRPHNSPFETAPEVVAALLALKKRYPLFGPLKLCALLDAPLHPRTAARILKRHGYSQPKQLVPEEVLQRFERSQSNELWQMDFKGLKRRGQGYEILSILDDATRCCLALRALPDQRLVSVWETLWSLFGEVGLPHEVLSDNGPAFGSGGVWRLSKLDAMLLRLGIRPTHGRPYHPQTQGKVERFHGTLQQEVGPDLYAPTLEEAEQRLEQFRTFYNWQRPHQALDQKFPGSLYRPSLRPRPSALPEPHYPEGSFLRRTEQDGYFQFKGQGYRAGKGLARQTIAIRECNTTGVLEVYFCDVKLATLDDLKVSRMSCLEVSRMY